MTDDFQLFNRLDDADAEVDPDIALIAAHLAHELSLVQIVVIQDRLASDPLFRSKVQPLIDGWSLPGSWGSMAAAPDATPDRATSLTRAEIEAGWQRRLADSQAHAAPTAAPRPHAPPNGVVSGVHVSTAQKRRPSMARIAATVGVIVLPMIAFAEAVRYVTHRSVGAGPAMVPRIVTPSVREDESTPPDTLGARPIVGDTPPGHSLSYMKAGSAVARGSAGQVTGDLVVPAGTGGPIRVLAAPDEFPHPFTSIVGVRELADGRVLLSNARDTSVQIIDFRSGALLPVGRKGKGLGEIAQVGPLLPAGRDTTLMIDSHNGVIHVFGPDGQPVRSAFARNNGAMSLSRGSDPDGRLYTVSGSIEPGAERSPVVRYTVPTQRFDTVTWYRPSPMDVTRSAAGPGGRGVRTSLIPFAVHDDWAVFPDGRVAIVRGSDYHIDFYQPSSAMTSGPPTSHDNIPVTDADKEDVLAPRRALAAAPHGQVPVTVEPSVWYDIKAPFGENAVRAGANGELWIEIASRADDSVPKFDVFDATGLRRRTVALPIGSRVIAVGLHALYVIRTAADGAQYLQRFAL